MCPELITITKKYDILKNQLRLLQNCLGEHISQLKFCSDIFINNIYTLYFVFGRGIVWL